MRDSAFFLVARTVRLGRMKFWLYYGRERLRSRENEERFSGSDIEIKELSFAELELRRREVGKWEGKEGVAGKRHRK